MGHVAWEPPPITLHSVLKQPPCPSLHSVFKFANFASSFEAFSWLFLRCPLCLGEYSCCNGPVYCSFSRYFAEICAPSRDLQVFALLPFICLSFPWCLHLPPCLLLLQFSPFHTALPEAEGLHRIVEYSCFTSLSLSFLICKNGENPAYLIGWFQMRGISSNCWRALSCSFGVLPCWCFNKKLKSGHPHVFTIPATCNHYYISLDYMVFFFPP